MWPAEWQVVPWRLPIQGTKLASILLQLRRATYLHREELDHFDCCSRCTIATTSLSQSALRSAGYAHDTTEVICRSVMTAEQCRAIRDAGWDTLDELLNTCSLGLFPLRFPPDFIFP